MNGTLSYLWIFILCIIYLDTDINTDINIDNDIDNDGDNNCDNDGDNDIESDGDDDIDTGNNIDNDGDNDIDCDGDNDIDTDDNIDKDGGNDIDTDNNIDSDGDNDTEITLTMMVTMTLTLTITLAMMMTMTLTMMVTTTWTMMVIMTLTITMTVTVLMRMMMMMNVYGLIQHLFKWSNDVTVEGIEWNPLSFICHIRVAYVYMTFLMPTDGHVNLDFRIFITSLHTTSQSPLVDHSFHFCYSFLSTCLRGLSISWYSRGKSLWTAQVRLQDETSHQLRQGTVSEIDLLLQKR